MIFGAEDTGRACGESSARSAQSGSSAEAEADMDGAEVLVADGTGRREGEVVKRVSRSDAKPARTVCALLGRALGRAMMKERVLGRQVVIGRAEVGATLLLVSQESFGYLIGSQEGGRRFNNGKLGKGKYFEHEL